MAAESNYGEQTLLNQLNGDISAGSTGSTAQSNALQQSILQRLSPIEQQQTSTEQTELANQGITPGSAAYENAMLPIQQQQNDLALGAVQTADTEQQQLYQDQLSTLGSMAQLYGAATNPTFASVPQVVVQPPSVAGTNVSSLVNQSYADQVAQAQAYNSALGGLLGGVGAAGLTLATGGAGLGALGTSLGLPGLLGIGAGTGNVVESDFDGQ